MNRWASRSIFNIFSCFALIASVLGSALVVTPAHAAGIMVNSAADVVANDGQCTLREAILAAESDTASGDAAGGCAAGSGDDDITFSGPFTHTLGSQLPDITTKVGVIGLGVGATIIQASTCNPVTLPGACTPATYGIFNVTFAGDLTVYNATVQYGAKTGINDGGAITNAGSLLVSWASLVANDAGGNGGAIFNSGTTLVVASTFTGNRSKGAGGGGGAIRSEGGLTVAYSTFEGNAQTGAGGNGGAISNGLFSGPANVSNSTFKDNSAQVGGGLFNASTVTVINSTFSGNIATGGVGNGGGLYTSTGSITLQNTLLANSGGGAEDCYNDPGTLSAYANNLIETNGPVGHTCGSPITSSDPGTLTYGSNGGTTQTFAITAGSAAHDAGDDTICTNGPIVNLDQRLYPRVSPCDIGAFEVQAPPVNDDFVSAIPFSSFPYTDANRNIRGATTEVNDPAFTCLGDPKHRSVWYELTMPFGREVTVDTISSMYDTVLGVWTGSWGSLSSVGCNDDYGGLQSQVKFFGKQGQTYYIEAAAFSSFPNGDLTLHATQVNRTTSDFDYDGTSDAAVFEKATGNWFVAGSWLGFSTPALGFGNDTLYIPVPGDYDGDLLTDAAVFERATGNWFVVGSTAGFFTPALGFGNDALYIPVPGDYDGDHAIDAAVFEKATGNWFVVGSTAGFFTPALGFGNDTLYIPVPGDYDGDGKTDPAVFEKATGNWFAVGSTGGFSTPALGFGNPAFLPVPGNYDGDLKTDPAVFEKATGNWFVVGSTDGFFTPALGFGNDTSYIPQPGDFDGDGWIDPAVFEKATGNWFVVGSSSGFMTPALGFGGPAYSPVVARPR